jgi:TIR domain
MLKHVRGTSIHGTNLLGYSNRSKQSMKIFLSWHGKRSRAIAEALNDWLRRVIQAVKPFYSPEIEKGAKWSGELDTALEGTRFGIICLTPDNLDSTWIHFEAGALSKTKDALIWTFLHELTPGDVPQPLGKFQHTVSEKDDTYRLLKSINGRLAGVGGEPLSDALLRDNFELFWPKLEEKLVAAKGISLTKPAQKQPQNPDMTRDERAILNEILELVRDQQRRTTFEPSLSPSMADVLTIAIPFEWAPDTVSQFADAVARNLRTTSLDYNVWSDLLGKAIRIEHIGPIRAPKIASAVLDAAQEVNQSSAKLKWENIHGPIA